MKKNIVIVLAFIFIVWLMLPNNMKKAAVVKAQNTTTTQTQDANLASAESGCPKYWRFNYNGYAQRCPTLSLTGVSLRTEELLKSYNLNNYNERVVIGRLHNIKTEVLVCITYADTSIGRFMKSTNNIGNVGNTDRGATVHYNSMLKGIDAIGRTLTNKYLGQYQELRQLAGSQNPSGPNYATELTNNVRSNNWIVNIQNCISLIHDKKIDGSFNFRLQ